MVCCISGIFLPFALLFFCDSEDFIKLSFTASSIYILGYPAAFEKSRPRFCSFWQNTAWNLWSRFFKRTRPSTSSSGRAEGFRCRSDRIYFGPVDRGFWSWFRCLSFTVWFCSIWWSTIAKQGRWKNIRLRSLHRGQSTERSPQVHFGDCVEPLLTSDVPNLHTHQRAIHTRFEFGGKVAADGGLHFLVEFPVDELMQHGSFAHAWLAYHTEFDDCILLHTN